MMSFLLQTGLCGAAFSMLAAEPAIRIVFPASGSRIVTTGQTYVIGSITPPDTPLIVNAQTVTPWRTGGFLFMTEVTPGTNTLRLRAGPAELHHTFTVPFPPDAEEDTGIRVLEPTRPVGVQTGEDIRLACRAPAGMTLSATVGERGIALAPSRDVPTHYMGSVAFLETATHVPVTFHAPDLPDAQAADLSAFSDPPAYVVTGPLFETRARSLPGDGAVVAFLSPGMTLLGAGHVGAHTRVWLNGARCFVETQHLADYCGQTAPGRDTRPPDITQGFGPHPPRGKKNADILVVLDPGHGGSSTGAVGPTGLTEKEVNLAQAFVVRGVLEQAGFRVFMTRETDVDMDLYARARFAYHAKADAFISIHHNATVPQTDPRRVRHVSSYAWNDIGLVLARALHPRIAAVTPIADRGVMTAGFAVCRNPAIPSCLLELDFITCPEGEDSIQQPEQQRRVSEAIRAGLHDWLSVPPR